MKRPVSHNRYLRLAGLVVVFLFGAGWVLAMQPDPEEPILARVGDVEVTTEAFRTRYADYLLRTGVPDKPALRRHFLNDLIATRLLIREARDNGVALEKSYQFRHDQVHRKLLVDAYIRDTLFDTLTVREDEVEAMFVRAYTQLKARHLYARTYEEAEVLAARLQAGETFDALALEVFADPKLADNGGSLGYFSFDELDPAFEDAAYALAIGEVSKPVQTAQGFSIIQLEDRFTKPLLTELEYAKKRPHLYDYVMRRKRQEARRVHVRQLAEDLAVTFEEEALAMLLGQITGAGMVDSKEAFQQFMGEPLVAFGPPAQRRAWTVDVFREHAQFTSDKQRAQVRTRKDLMAFVEGLVVRAAMMEQAQQRALDATEKFEHDLNEEMDDYVLGLVRERMDAEVEVSEDSARSYFETAPPGEFIYPAQVQMGEILLETKAEAEHVKAQLAHIAFEKLAQAYTVRPGARARQGDLGFLPVDELGPFSEALSDAPSGQVLGPFETQGYYALLKVGERQDARPMTFAEAQGQIMEMLHLRYTQDHQRAVYEDLQTRYDIDVDTNLLYSLPLTHGNDI